MIHRDSTSKHAATFSAAVRLAFYWSRADELREIAERLPFEDGVALLHRFLWWADLRDCWADAALMSERAV